MTIYTVLIGIIVVGLIITAAIRDVMKREDKSHSIDIEKEETKIFKPTEIKVKCKLKIEENSQGGIKFTISPEYLKYLNDKPDTEISNFIQVKNFIKLNRYKTIYCSICFPQLNNLFYDVKIESYNENFSFTLSKDGTFKKGNSL